ncbi:MULTISPECIES: carbohydrate kinase family protein [unclassified Microbacterium]|uniref:carbohydrate kinase family protein n=1 Tax=unclassified Microbacterium TaxID=2609290 RepID=UPI00343E8071
MAPSTDEPRILVVGEALVDIVHRLDGSVTETPGGSPANVALGLGRLGRTPTLLSSIGTDDRGDALRRWLAESGVALVGTPRERTSTATAELDSRGAASYRFAIDWELDADDAPIADALHVGSIAVALDPGARAVAQIVDRHRGRALISADPNVRPSLVPGTVAARVRMLDLLARADVVKASDEDLAWMFPGVDLRRAGAELLGRGSALVVITQGAEGVIALREREAELRVPAVSVDVVDTVGAGDTFMAAMLDGLVSQGISGADGRARLRALHRSTLAEILQGAAEAASLTVGRPGADLPSRADLDALRARTTAPV